MERVQFQQEQMLAELKDLVDKGLFTQIEIKQIMKKRTEFETNLVRRIAKKNDYLRYIAYEMSLEALRKLRVARLKLPRTTPSVSDYALVRRQFHIFERALKKFKSDVGLWVQYIELAKKEEARSLVGRICARALQLHPNVPALYILAASHELTHLSPSAARTLLQRGIRLNADSVEMWTEYLKMELGFVESMRRRWNVLGIQVNKKGKGKAHDDSGGAMDESQVEQIQDDADGDGDEAEQARKEIMQGAIVKSVIANAVKALPKAELFASFHSLLATYPTTPDLRTALLDHLHDLLQQTLPTDPVSAKLYATRHLLPELEGTALVDALKAANEQLLSAVNSACTSARSETAHGMALAYAGFIEEWVQKEELDTALRAYLLTSIHVLITRVNDKESGVSAPAPAPLLSTHLRLLSRYPSVSVLLPYAKSINKLAKRYTSLDSGKTDSQVWLARMEAEKAFASAGAQVTELQKTCQEARSVVQGDGTIDVWLWQLSSPSDALEEEKARQETQTLEGLLSESMRMQDAPSFRVVHDGLLRRYASLITSIHASKCRMSFFRKISTSYLPEVSTFAAIFQAETSLPSEAQSEDLLKETYQAWKRRNLVAATLAWASWLLRQGRGKDAADAIQNARAQAGEQRQALDDEWRQALQQMESANAEGAEASDIEMQEES